MAIKSVYTNPKKIWILQLYIQILKNMDITTVHTNPKKGS